MKLRFGLIAAVLGALAALAIPWPASAGSSLAIGGTGAVTEALRTLAPAFEAETGIMLNIVPGLGTSGANNAVADGKLGLAIAGRDLRDKEMANGLQVMGVLRTPFGFVTSRPGPDNLKKAEIIPLYKSTNPTWPDGMPALIALRPVDESDNEVLEALFPGMAKAQAQQRKRHDLSIAATDQDNADFAEMTKGSLVAATLTQIKAEKRKLRFVAIDGVTPSLQAYLDGSYPYGKTLSLVATAMPSPEAKAFVQFIVNPANRQRLGALGLIAGAP